MKVRAVCFDLFNTLVSVGRVPDSVGRYTADILGIDRERWNWACFSADHEITRPTHHLEVIRGLARSIDPTIPDETIAEAAAHRQRRFDHALQEVETEILSGLQALRTAGLKLALVSNASTAEVAAWPRSPLVRHFDSAVFSCECGYRKPEAGIYTKALDALGVYADQTLFVGDGGSDEHHGARAVGLRPYLLTHFIAAERQADAVARHAEIVEKSFARFSELVEGVLRQMAE